MSGLQKLCAHLQTVDFVTLQQFLFQFNFYYYVSCVNFIIYARLRVKCLESLLVTKDFSMFQMKASSRVSSTLGPYQVLLLFNFFMLEKVGVYISRTFRNIKTKLCVLANYVLRATLSQRLNSLVYLLSTYYMPSTMLGLEFVVKKRDNSYFYEIYHLLGEIDIKEIIT